MKIKLTILTLFLGVASGAYATETTVINNVSAKATTGGNSTSEEKSVTTGDARSKVYVETLINEEEPIITHEIQTSEDGGASVSVTQKIENSNVYTEIHTSPTSTETLVSPKDPLPGDASVNSTAAEPTPEIFGVDKTKKIKEDPENSTLITALISWFKNVLTRLFT